MSNDLLLGIGVGTVLMLVFLAVRFMMRPKEIEMNSYSNFSPVQADEKPRSFDTPRKKGTFRMLIDDTFNIKGRGLVITGNVESGTLTVGEQVYITDGIQTYESTVKNIESYKKKMQTAKAGDHIGILLSNLSKEEVKKGMIISS